MVCMISFPSTVRISPLGMCRMLLWFETDSDFVFVGGEKEHSHVT